MHFSAAPGQEGPQAVVVPSECAAPLPQATSTSPSAEDPQKSAQADNYPSGANIPVQDTKLPASLHKNLLYSDLISQCFFLPGQSCLHSLCSARSQSTMAIY